MSKGKVERSIRYLRDRFLAGRTISSIEQGNTQLLRFLDQTASQRVHPVLGPRTVAQVLAEEQPRLLPLPYPLPQTDLLLATKADRQAFVRVDTNRYSVPVAYVDRPLTARVDDKTVHVLCGDACIATHPRSYGKRQCLEQPAHRAAIVAQRRAASELKGRDRLRAVAPAFPTLLERWVASGPSLALLVTRAIKLLDLYGDELFAAAVHEVVALGLQDISALAVACDRLRRDRHRPLPMTVPLATHIQDRDVIPHNLETYDDRDDH